MSILALLATGSQRSQTAQFLRPISDNGGGTWTAEPAGQHWEGVDDAASDGDTTYIQQGAVGSQVDFELTNAGVNAPFPLQVVKFHALTKDHLAAGLTGSWTAELWQGDPAVAGSKIVDLFTADGGPPNGSYVDQAMTFSTADKAAVTDWNDLYVRVIGNFSSGTFRITQIYLEIEE